MTYSYKRKEVIWRNALPIQKNKSGESISVVARQLENFILEYNDRFNLRDYDKSECMKFIKLLVRDAIYELKTYFPEMLA